MMAVLGDLPCLRGDAAAVRATPEVGPFLVAVRFRFDDDGRPLTVAFEHRYVVEVEQRTNEVGDTATLVELRIEEEAANDDC